LLPQVLVFELHQSEPEPGPPLSQTVPACAPAPSIVASANAAPAAQREFNFISKSPARRAHLPCQIVKPTHAQPRVAADAVLLLSRTEHAKQIRLKDDNIEMKFLRQAWAGRMRPARHSKTNAAARARGLKPANPLSDIAEALAM
jgi:hypothetical protein